MCLLLKIRKKTLPLPPHYHPFNPELMSRNIYADNFGDLPPVTKNLLIVNVLCFIVAGLFEEAYQLPASQYLGLHIPVASDFYIFQYVTSMFMHGSISHLFFNMLCLWMFGAPVERFVGSRRFFQYYMLTGIFAGVLYSLIIWYRFLPDIQLFDTFLQTPNADTLTQLFNKFELYSTESKQILLEQLRGSNSLTLAQDIATAVGEYKDSWLNSHVAVGASGALYGVLLAFGMLFPSAIIYLFMFIPMPARMAVIVFAISELSFEFANMPGDNIAHLAHLTGMLVGYILVKYWRLDRFIK